MEILTSAKEITKKDKLKLSGLTDSFKELAGKRIEIINAVVFKDVDRETGELREYSAILTVDNGVITAYAGNSAVLKECVENLISLDVFESDEDTITATVTMKKTKDGSRDYIGLIF